MDKYNIDFSNNAKEQNLKRLINQLWKLIPMKENNEDWVTHLSIVIEELSGLAELYRNKAEGLILLSKLEGLTSKECENFMKKSLC